MTYSEFVTALADLMVLGETITDPASATPSTDTNFNDILPSIITYAEQRIYRELDLLATVSSPAATLVAGSRSVAIPGSLIVVQEVNVITPAGYNPNQAGSTRVPLQRVSLDVLNFQWPSTTQTGVPEIFAIPDNLSVVFGPAPDSTYAAEFVGTTRPAPLSPGNPNTLLTNYLPDLFLAASMIFASGYMRNFGSQADEPATAQSWSAQYDKLLQSAIIETQRQKSQGASWQSFSPAPLVTPARN